MCAKISQTWLANVCDMAKVDGITILSLDGRPQDPSLPLSIPGTCILLRLEFVLAFARKHCSGLHSFDEVLSVQTWTTIAYKS